MTLKPVEADLIVRTVDEFEPTLTVRRFGLVEGLDQPAELVTFLEVPFEIALEVVTSDLGLDVRALLGARASFQLTRPQQATRAWHGVVTCAEYLTTHSQQLFARLVVEPSLALLRYSRRRRIFADHSVSEVLGLVCADVFASHGGEWDFGRVTRPFPRRDYVVQYDETDLEFTLRLLCEAGLLVLVAQGGEGADKHTTYVVVEESAAFPCLGDEPNQPSSPSTPTFVPFIPGAEEEADSPSVQYLGRTDHARPAASVALARDWKTPGASVFGTPMEGAKDRGSIGRVWMYHPRRLNEGERSEGKHIDSTPDWARRMDQDNQAAGTEVVGASNFVEMAAGCTFELDGHPHPDLDQRYAVVGVVHRGDFPSTEISGANVGSSYTNRIAAQPLELPVRPRLRAQSRVTGPETAVVVGPKGEEIHTDALGRVRARFHWDEGGSTCWLRVAHSWAGPGFGTMFIPRVGMEVVVSFLDGDPDRPIVTGCVYTGTNMPPLALPEEKTRSTIRTQSTPDDDGSNELRFEDARGREEIFVHAQRNLRTRVRANENTSIGAARSLSVGGSSKRTVGGTETVEIGGARNEDGSPGDLTVSVAGDETRVVDHSYTVGAGVIDHTSKTAITLTAEDSIKLVVGDASLELTRRGVFIDGPVVNVSGSEVVWLSADAGRVELNQEHLKLFAGRKSETTTTMTVDRVETNTPGTLYGKADMILHDGTTSAAVKSKKTEVIGFDEVVVHSNRDMKVNADDMTLEARGIALTAADAKIKTSGGLSLEATKKLDAKGTPIHLNCD